MFCFFILIPASILGVECMIPSIIVPIKSIPIKYSIIMSVVFSIFSDISANITDRVYIVHEVSVLIFLLVVIFFIFIFFMFKSKSSPFNSLKTAIPASFPIAKPASNIISARVILLNNSMLTRGFIVD